MRRLMAVLTASLTAALVAPLVPGSPAAAATRHDVYRSPGRLVMNAVVARADGAARTLSDPTPWAYQSPSQPGSYQKVCSRDRLWRGNVSTGSWTLVTRAARSCQSIPAAKSRTFLIGAKFTNLGLGVLYATDARVTWYNRAGRVLGRVLLDYGQKRDYACGPGCTIAANTESSYGVVLSALPPAPSPTLPVPPPPPAAPTYPDPGQYGRPNGWSNFANVGGGITMTGGSLDCPSGGGAVVVTGPSIVDNNPFDHPVQDYYQDTIWVWDTAAGHWQALGYGPWQVRNRLTLSGWVDLTTGDPLSPIRYNVQTGHIYTVTQNVYEGVYGGQWNLATVFLTPTSTFYNCRA